MTWIRVFFPMVRLVSPCKSPIPGVVGFHFQMAIFEWLRKKKGGDPYFLSGGPILQVPFTNCS